MNILSEEILKKYKYLRKNNPEILWVQEFFRNYVKDIINNTWTFTIDDFNIVDSYFEDLKKYYNIAKEKWVSKSIEIVKLFILWQNINEFKKMLENEKVIFLIKNWNIENLKLFLWEKWVINSKKDLEDLIDKWFSSYIVSYINYDDNLISAYKKWFSCNNIWWNMEILFPVDSPWSKTLDEIFKLMKNSPDKDIYEILREKTRNYIEKIEIKKQKKGDKEIAIYLRYWQIVDYPEIWETIIIFLQEAIKKWIIKWVNGVKILPRIKYVTPRNDILDENSRFCNVEWDDFVRELNNNSIPFYLSHSTNESSGFCITSWKMKTKYGQINSWLEIEDFGKSNTSEKNINEIFDIIIWIIRKINGKKD